MKITDLRYRAQLLRQVQRAQAMRIEALLYKGPEREYLGVLQGLADATVELIFLRDLLE